MFATTAKIDTSYDNAIMMMEHDTMPDSPPDLSSSKTSKTSSFHSSYNSDDSTIYEDANHFEEIGLDDTSRSDRLSDLAYGISSTLTLSPTAIGDKTYLPTSATRFPIHIPTSALQLQRKTSKSDLHGSKARPPYVQNALRNAAPLDIHNKALGLMGPPSRKSSRNISNPTQLTLSLNYKRNTSPVPMNSPRNYPANGNARYSAPIRSPSYLARRTSWQSNRERKTADELEKECDEEDGDDVPEDCFLENVPISPRPPQDRTPSNSRPTSRNTSAERLSKPKSKVRSMGNGTPAADVERGSLRSPASRSPCSPRPISPNPRMGEFPIDHGAFIGKVRAKSWSAAMSELSAETRELTEALESHASELELTPRPISSRKSSSAIASRPTGFAAPQRVKSSMAELPPLRRTNIMIDPLPPSKEKAAVLSRTRPSWLPPKDPEEEKRHLREYKRMMALSVEADKKKDAETRQKEVARDEVADSLQRIWEEFVLKDWRGAMKQKRTRELWWRGISPRCRGAVWQKAIKNELELTESSYLAALRRAKDLEKKIQRGQANKEEERMGGWFENIRRDAKRTLPELMIFQEGGPLCEVLVNVLMAYSMYRSDVGYVPGTHTITALLLLNLPSPSSSFSLLANLLNRSLPLAFHTHDPIAITTTHNLILTNLLHKFPALYTHLSNSSSTISIADLLIPIFTSLFTNGAGLGLDEITRLWDVYVFEGDAVLVRAGIALLGVREQEILLAGSREEVLSVMNGRGLTGSVLNGSKDGEVTAMTASSGNSKSLFGGEDEWMIKVRNAGKC